MSRMFQGVDILRMKRRLPKQMGHPFGTTLSGPSPRLGTTPSQVTTNSPLTPKVSSEVIIDMRG